MTFARRAVVHGLVLATGLLPLLPLHAIRGADPRIADSAGRQVLLRGVDVDALGHYYQQYPKYPAVLPLTANDFKEMAGLGFNVVRLILNWSELEPTPGAFNLSYVARIRRAVQQAGANGIYVVLDMHQDAWGIGVMGHAGEDCPPESSPPVGYDGAPEWATFTDGLPTCAIAGTREISLADEAAWQNFYDNTHGIETQLALAWGRLAAQFARDPTVAGYDLLNEPNPGLIFDEATGGLGNYYSEALAAIRTGERSVKGGFSHIAFFEPGVEWSLLGTTVTPQGAFTRDPNIVFAPHLYGGSLAVASVDQGVHEAQVAAAPYKTTVWSGEYGWYGDPAQNAADEIELAREQDAHLWGGAWWQWKQACGSPSSVGNFGGAIPTETNSLIRFGCKTPLPSAKLAPANNLAIPQVTERIIARATVHAAPGKIESLRSTPATGAFSLTGNTTTRPATRLACMLAVWIPGARKPRFATTGITKLKATRVRGGYDVSGCARGHYQLRLLDPAPRVPG